MNEPQPLLLKWEQAFFFRSMVMTLAKEKQARGLGKREGRDRGLEKRQDLDLILGRD